MLFSSTYLIQYTAKIVFQYYLPSLFCIGTTILKKLPIMRQNEPQIYNILSYSLLRAVICFCFSHDRIFVHLVPTPKHRRNKYSQYLRMDYAVIVKVHPEVSPETF